MKKGIVLEGGGVKGAYQIGAYYAIKDCHVKIDGFVGTSIGSFNAAMLASGKFMELLNFWYNVSPGIILGFDENFINAFNGEDLSITTLKGAFNTLKNIILNMGIDNKNLQDKLYELLDFDDFKNSSYDFGLVTVRLPKMEPVYVYKEDLSNIKELCEYILASCYLPVFREKRIIDNHFYVDGGFYDNSPVEMLAKKGYEEIYVINVKGIGINRKYSNDNIKIINVKPSRNNGSILELSTDVIRDNIKMGYYDTLRIVKKLDGFKYCFYKKSDFYYDFILRKIDKRLIRRVSNFFNVSDNRDIVIKALEYVLEKDNVNYYDVYRVGKLLKMYRKNTNKNFVYKFVSQLRFF